ncbi:MAG: imidazoleglycerol-phosphate dehydratase HisB [bacterium]|nr:imidazoleglycerol-phosphate dehydratase HisB [bacterium]
MKQRSTTINRQTNETNVTVDLNLDGIGKTDIKAPVGFLNHMLDLFGQHGLFDLKIQASGDNELYKDEHHVVEDIGIVLGQAFANALGDKKGINRYGFFILLMDEALATVAIDFSGRCAFNFQCEFLREKVGDLSTELVYDFWDAFAQNAKANVFIKVENARNDHHKIEAIFKAIARACRIACEEDERSPLSVPSSKGVL